MSKFSIFSLEWYDWPDIPGIRARLQCD